MGSPLSMAFPIACRANFSKERHDGHGQGEVAIQDQSGVTRRALLG